MTTPSAQDRTLFCYAVKEDGVRKVGEFVLDRLLPTPNIGQIVQWENEDEDDDEEPEAFTVVEVRWLIKPSGGVDLWLDLEGESLRETEQ